MPADLKLGMQLRGERELALIFDTFPQRARTKIIERMQQLTQTLQQRSAAAAPYKSGRLQSEIQGRVFSDNPDRVAGYVGVIAEGGDSNEYAKAASLEYGVNAIRKRAERTEHTFLSRIGLAQAKIVQRASAGRVHQKAFRYLRDPFEGMQGEVEQALAEALAEAVDDANSSGGEAA